MNLFDCFNLCCVGSGSEYGGNRESSSTSARVPELSKGRNQQPGKVCQQPEKEPNNITAAGSVFLKFRKYFCFVRLVERPSSPGFISSPFHLNR